MVVALVLLQLEGLDNEGEVIVDLLQLLPVELLRLYQFLPYRLLCRTDSATHLLQLLQKTRYLHLTRVPRDRLGRSKTRPALRRTRE